MRYAGVWLVLCAWMLGGIAWADDLPAVERQSQEKSVEETQKTDEPSKPMSVADLQKEQQLARLLEEGFAAIRADFHQTALGKFEQALKLDASNRNAKFGLATTLSGMGDYEKSIQLLNELLEYPDPGFHVKNNLAWIYATASDVRFRDSVKALDLARAALLEADRDYHVWSTLAEAYFIAGTLDKALESAQIALQLARQAGVKGESLEQYAQQVEKCKNARTAAETLK